MHQLNTNLAQPHPQEHVFDETYINAKQFELKSVFGELLEPLQTLIEFAFDQFSVVN